VGKPEGKRPGRKNVNSFKVGIREIRWERVDWIYLAQGYNKWRDVVNAAMKLLFTSTVRNLLTILVTISFSRKTWFM